MALPLGDRKGLGMKTMTDLDDARREYADWYVARRVGAPRS